MSPPHLTLYTRRDCHLCDEAYGVLDRARARGGEFVLNVVDIDSDPGLKDRYGSEVPVLLIDGKKFAKVRFDERRLSRRLGI